MKASEALKQPPKQSWSCKRGRGRRTRRHTARAGHLESLHAHAGDANVHALARRLFKPKISSLPIIWVELGPSGSGRPSCMRHKGVPQRLPSRSPRRRAAMSCKRALVKLTLSQHICIQARARRLSLPLAHLAQHDRAAGGPGALRRDAGLHAALGGQPLVGHAKVALPKGPAEGGGRARGACISLHAMRKCSSHQLHAMHATHKQVGADRRTLPCFWQRQCY